MSISISATRSKLDVVEGNDETGALTKSANQFGGFLVSFNKERLYRIFARGEAKSVLCYLTLYRRPSKNHISTSRPSLVREDNIQKVNQEELK